jgi:hypothetical protein
MTLVSIWNVCWRTQGFSMSCITKWNLACFLAVALNCVYVSAGYGGLILSDDFDYADSTALRVNWKDVVSGSSPDFNNTFAFSGTSSGLISDTASQRPATLTNQTLMGLNGRSTYRELGTTVDTDFVLTAYVGINAYSRTLQIGLGDATGAGYSFTWNAAQPTGSSGNGVFNLRKETAWAGAPTLGSTISSNQDGTSPPTRYPLPNPILGGDGRVNYSSTNSVFLGYSKIELKWTAATGELEVLQDGTSVGTATDTTYNSFTRVYAGGGNRSYVDLLTLETVEEVPEPAGVVLLAIGCVALLAGRRNGVVRK